MATEPKSSSKATPPALVQCKVLSGTVVWGEKGVESGPGQIAFLSAADFAALKADGIVGQPDVAAEAPAA